MSQVNGSSVASERTSRVGAVAWRLAGGVRRLFEGVGFWGAVLLPFVAVVLLVVRPTGWVPLLAGVFVANVLGALAGHCYGVEC